MKKIVISTSVESSSTEVYIGQNLLTSTVIKEFCGQYKGKKIIVADLAVKDLYAADLAKHIGAQILTIPSGEKSKSQETTAYLMDALFKIGAERDTTLIALGGGVTTDLVGFVASIYMRGVPLILIPTTLLGVIDASIGGKTAIDTSFGKNLIGTLYHPKAIFTDLDTLQTLPEKEWFNGLAELLKIGLIYNASLLEQILTNEHDPLLFILGAIQAKIAIIERDPTEQGLRHILNFGHTIGHALETASNYEISHGEAVALGCLAESHLSMQLGFLSEEDFEQIQTMYSHFPLKLPTIYNRAKLIEAMAHDKKKTLGKTRFVLIDRIGHALSFKGAYCCTVTPSELEPTLAWMETTY